MLNRAFMNRGLRCAPRFISQQHRLSSSLSELVAARASSHAGSTAVIAPQQDVEWTYAEFDQKASLLAKGLLDNVGYETGQSGA